jgi:membrane protein implicated in regulation of membrane protease activity
MEKNSNPLWETLVMIGSFLLLWAWFLARSAAQRANAPLQLYWQGALVVALLALVYVTVRRIRRVQRALRGEDEQGNVTPMYPMFGTPPKFGDPPDKKR